MIQAIATILDFAPAHWSSGTRMVAIALADRVNHEWLAWPGLGDIARRTGLDERQVRRHLRQLEAEGVIRLMGQRVTGGKAGSNLWEWMWTMTGRSGRADIHDPLRADMGVRPSTRARADIHDPRTVITNHQLEPSPGHVA